MTMDKSPNLSEVQIPRLYVTPCPDFLTRLLQGSNKGMDLQGLCKLNNTECMVGMIILGFQG